MLTVTKWRMFWLKLARGVLLQLAIVLSISAALSSGFSYMGQDADSLIDAIMRTQALLVVEAVVRVLGSALFIAFLMHCVSFALHRSLRFVFAFLFSVACLVRMAAMYPAVAQNVRPFTSEWGTSALTALANLAPATSARDLVEWSPFWLGAFFLFLNFAQVLRHLLRQNEKIRAARRSFVVDEFERESRRMAMGAVAFVLAAAGGAWSLYEFSSSLEFSFPEAPRTARPNVFIFAVDSLRVDRVLDPKFEEVMPFVQSRMSDAVLAQPMLVGVPRTFPSWVEISTCQYATRTGVRTMFPSRSARQVSHETLFSKATASGYFTTLVSDFAGDIFNRFPFGISHVEVPDSNLSTLIENSVLQNAPALQAILTLPRFHRNVPSLLETPSFADPRLVAFAFSEVLNQKFDGSRPVFSTLFFSQAHFPYAAPAPYFKKFQKSENGSYLYKKESDQTSGQARVEVSDAHKEQVKGLYDSALFTVDNSIERLMTELQNKGWLDNAIVILMGDHGENLYDGGLGMGHGDDASSEFSTSTPLVIWTFGRAADGQSPSQGRRVVRTVDVAPTISKRLNFKFDEGVCDGMALLDSPDKASSFSPQVAYQETGIWFTPGAISPAGFSRVDYPGIVGLLDLDSGHNGEFYLRSVFSPTVLSAKERSWINEKYRLVARTTATGVRISLYDREIDPAATHDLLSDKATEEVARQVASVMFKQLADYLLKSGVEIIQNKQDSVVFADNETK